MKAAAADLVVRDTSYDSCIILLPDYRKHSNGTEKECGQVTDFLKDELTITSPMKTAVAQKICNDTSFRNNHPIINTRKQDD